MSLRADTRGRITIVEVLTGTFALAFVAALWPVVADALDSSAGVMSTGEVYLMRILLPLMLVVLLTVVFVTAGSGGGRI
jgi:cytochrome c biogenesis factor